jgi:hypothetical protein
LDLGIIDSISFNVCTNTAHTDIEKIYFITAKEACEDGGDNDRDGSADRWDLDDCMHFHHAQTCPGGPLQLLTILSPFFESFCRIPIIC